VEQNAIKWVHILNAIQRIAVRNAMMWNEQAIVSNTEAHLVLVPGG